MKKLLLILLCVPLIYSCGGNDPNAVKFEEIGYYKSEDKYRCYAYTFDKDDEAQILKHAKQRIHTNGRTTQVYYFSKLPLGLGNYELLNQRSFFEAMNYCFDLDWIYQYGKSPNGKENFYKNEKYTKD